MGEGRILKLQTPAEIKQGAFTFVYFLTHYAAIFNVIRYVAHCLSRINLSSLTAWTRPNLSPPVSVISTTGHATAWTP